jgi:Transposase domain (DUF772)
MKQTTFASGAWERKGKVTRRERCLSEMDQVIPWVQIQALIEPHYPKVGSTQPMPLERMLRIHFMQQWFNLSDPAMEDSLYCARNHLCRASLVARTHLKSRFNKRKTAATNETKSKCAAVIAGIWGKRRGRRACTPSPRFYSSTTLMNGNSRAVPLKRIVAVPTPRSGHLWPFDCNG